jgi:hypothetical protein
VAEKGKQGLRDNAGARALCVLFFFCACYDLALSICVHLTQSLKQFKNHEFPLDAKKVKQSGPSGWNVLPFALASGAAPTAASTVDTAMQLGKNNYV